MGKSSKVLLGVLFPVFLAVATARAANMKLLTPETGWALAGPGLMWTTDGGADWANITPPLPAGEHITTVFFLNTQDGWALLTGPNEGSHAPRFDMAITEDSGATWSIVPFDIPGFNPTGYGLSGGGHIFFLDTLNGWADLDIPGLSRQALLLETHDGGRNWSLPPSNPNVAGQLRFINSKLGWILGGPSGDDLYATRNGGQSWAEISLGATVDGSPVTCSANGLPHFRDNAHGYLAGSCMGGAVALFATRDGGKTWKQRRVLLGAARGGGNLATTLADATLIIGKIGGQTFTLVRDTPGGVVSSNANIPLLRAGVVGLSFANATRGWALLLYHHTETSLFLTSDSGSTWTDITPQMGKNLFPAGARSSPGL